MGKATKSITQHPLFPALMTLWWGAFFGLSSLVIGRPTLEQWVVASGLPNYLAAAQPPLGSTARVLLALAACGLGAVIGLLLSALFIRSDDGEEAAEEQYVEEAEDDPEAIEAAERPLLEEPEVTEPVAGEPAFEDLFDEEIEPVTSDYEPADAEPDFEERVPLATVVDDPLARFLRPDGELRDEPRQPFSVFDELGRDGAIPAALEEEPAAEDDEPEAEDDSAALYFPPLSEDAAAIEPAEEAEQSDVAPEPVPEPMTEAEPDAETAPEFAGSPALPSNVHSISAVRLAEHGLPTRFEPETASDESEDQPPVDAPRAPQPVAAAPAPEPAPVDEPLEKLSYVQLTERLAKAIAANPKPPAQVRGAAVPNPANEPREDDDHTIDSDDIRDALSGLRNLGGAA